MLYSRRSKKKLKQLLSGINRKVSKFEVLIKHDTV
jgi:hypothetical protein